MKNPYHQTMKALCEYIDNWCARRGWMLSCIWLGKTCDMAYIGNLRTAYFLCVEYGIEPELRTETSKTCSIGYSKKHGKWYGWSHRAIYGFATREEACEFAESVS